MVLFLSCNAIFNKNSRKTICFRPRGPFFVAMVLHVFTWISDRLFERLLLVWKQVLQLPCRLWWRCHVQLGCCDWDPYNSQLGIATSLTQIKRETVLRIQFNLRLEAVFFGCFLGFNGWQVGSACPGSCGHLWSLWGWHYSGNTSCATDSGCSCEADELACQDPVYRCKSTKFAYDEKIILFAMILYLSPIPGLWMLQMQSKSVQRNGWRWWSCD